MVSGRMYRLLDRQGFNGKVEKLLQIGEISVIGGLQGPYH